jgi:hypothetical protein
MKIRHFLYMDGTAFRVKCMPVIIAGFILMSCGQSLPEYVAIPYQKLPDKIEFNLDVKPILSDKCYSCHGPDQQTRKAGLRFDTEDGLFQKSNNGNFAFKPGNLSKSASIERILSEDSDFIMPPPDSHLSLTAREKAVLIKWVEQGAEWKKHWAFIPPEKPSVPKIDKNWNIGNEIDNFVYAQLAQSNLGPSELTSKEQLLRRVTIDLTGLVPTLSEIESFINDNGPDAYEKVVDRLLSSDAYAERLTTEWLDVARYADSHGYHADGSRMMWPWRDWVIKAFQNNKPYNEFVTEQLAGDLLPNPTKEQILATAFNRNHPTTAEGGAIDEEFRVEYVTNRTNTFGTAFLGMTMECAKCHDHKFDPISQKDYFELFAFFNNIKELGMTANDGNAGPLLLLSDSVVDKKVEALTIKIDSLEIIESQNKKQFIEDSNFKTSNKFSQIEPLLHHSFEKIRPHKKTRILDDKLKTTVTKGMELEEGIFGMAANFDHQYDQITISNLEALDIEDAFSVSVWISLKQMPSETKTMTLIGNSSVKHQFYRGWDLYIEPSGRISSRLIHSLPGNYIHNRSKETIEVGEWTHLLMTYDGSAKASGLKLYINGEAADQEISYDRLDQTIIPDSKGQLIVGKSPRGQTGDFGIFIGMMDELSIFDTEILPLQASVVYEQSKARETPVAWRPNDSQFSELKKNLHEFRALRHATIDTVKEIMVMKEMPQLRKTFILDRGAYDARREEVGRDTPDGILPFSDEYPKNRLGLSQWLLDENNPLMARVTVNRYWQMIFGKGLVTSTNDFGNQGALPTHPKLLDWLSLEFVESGWDLRKLLRKMVTSNVYKQSSFANPELRNLDPENKLLARSPSYRYQAEFIRDNALKSSGLLNTKIGGESVKPYQPEGLWIEKGNFSKVLLYYVQDRDDKQYRKSMYTFNKRTSPPPYMEIFDVPGRTECIVYRERTNTPLQALSLLNDPQFVESSRALAYRMKKEGGVLLEDQIKIGFLLTLNRNPSDQELQIMTDLYNEELENFRMDKQSAKAYLSVGDHKLPNEFQETELAAMTFVASTLFNMDEMYTKR